MLRNILQLILISNISLTYSMIEEPEGYREEFAMAEHSKIINNNEANQDKDNDDQSETHCHTVQNDCTESYCIALKNTKCLTINDTNKKNSTKDASSDDFSKLPQNRPHYLCDISEKLHPNNFNENECCHLDLIENLELIEDPVYY